MKKEKKFKNKTMKNYSKFSKVRKKFELLLREMKFYTYTHTYVQYTHGENIEIYDFRNNNACGFA